MEDAAATGFVCPFVRCLRNHVSLTPLFLLCANAGASMYGPREKFVYQQGEWISVPSSGKGWVEQDGVFIQGDLESDEDA